MVTQKKANVWWFQGGGAPEPIQSLNSRTYFFSQDAPQGGEKQSLKARQTTHQSIHRALLTAGPVGNDKSNQYKDKV